MQAAQETLEKKNQELVDLYREKSKKLSQMTNLYNILKARTMRSQMQTAASDTVSQALNTMTLHKRSSAPKTPSGPSRLSTGLAARPPQSPSLPMSSDGIERLHRYQRSGTGSSRRAGNKTKDAITMPPPGGRPVFDVQKGLSLCHLSRAIC